MTAATQPDITASLALLAQARTRTLLLVSDLAPQQWLGPKLDIVNPPLWELGHLGWFEEKWCLRHGGNHVESLLTGADALYDSARVEHERRWSLPLPTVAATLRYLEQVRNAVTRLVEDGGRLGYFVHLSACHEEMHCEAFTYTRQTLGYAAPATTGNALAGGAWDGDVEISGGRYQLGAIDDGSFVFDNEKWAHSVDVRPFRMARAPVSNAQFAEFVEAGGYANRDFWSEAGWSWRLREAVEAPRYWRRTGAGWHRRHFADSEPLRDHEPVTHVSWYEAEAWCRWAGRRLPSEAEWEFAAATVPGEPESKRTYPWGEAAPTAARANLFGTSGRCVPVDQHAAGDSAWGMRQMLGNVWEWTADWFQPYPGFRRDPYAEYSEPWFGNHKVLRGGCHATRAGLIRNTWRNFYTPDRNDVYSGFRTCAP